MSSNDVNRVGESIKNATDKITKAADTLQARIDALANDTLDKFGKVDGVCNEWAKANDSLNNFLGTKTNDPGGRDDGQSGAAG